MIIVDTHAVVWLTQDEKFLSPAARTALIDGRQDGKLAIADITLREIAFQIARGRISVSRPLDEYLRFVESLYSVLPVTSQIAGQSTRFSLSYPRDPADRLIGATAVVHGARLVTKDEKIRASGEVDCIW